MFRNNLTLLAFLAVPTIAKADGATVTVHEVDIDVCQPARINPPPGSGLPPIDVLHCFTAKGVERQIVTPSGLEIRTYHGSLGFEDTDAYGNVVSYMDETSKNFNLVKDESGEWFVHHAQISRCMETPWGYGVMFDLRDHLANGEWQFKLIEAGNVESCE